MNKELIHKFLEGKCSSEELKYLTSYFQSEDMEELDTMIRKTWDQSVDWPVHPVLKETMWDAIDQATDLDPPANKNNRVILPFALAALVMLVIGLSSYFFLLAPKVHQISNMDIGPMQVAMADGSSIWLNSGANLTYEEGFGQTHRNLSLSGEAFFDVSHNETLPFIVTHGDLSTKVHGTSFNIKKVNNGTPVISLFEGKVQVYDATDSWYMKPGEELSYREHQASIVAFDLSNNHVLAWKNQLYEFKNASVLEVISVLLEHHNTTLSLDEKLLEGKRITCEVGFNENLKNALDIILYPHDMKANYLNGNLVIMKNKKTDKVPPK